MRLLIILSFLYCTTGFSQPKGYAIQDFTEGSHYVFAKQKNKIGIYNKAKGEFLVEPHKGYIINLPGPQLLLDIYPKDEKLILYHYYQDKIQLIESTNPNGNFLFGRILGSQWDTELAVSFVKGLDGFWLEEGVLMSVDPNNEENYRSEGGITYSFTNDYLLFNLYHDNSFEDARIAVESIEYPPEDSIDANGEVVYYPQDYKEISNSGCFNLKTGIWDVLPKYKEVKEWEGIYAAHFWPNKKNNPSLMEKGVVYDFYKMVDDQILPTAYLNTQEFAFPLDLWPFEDEKVWYDLDSIYIYHKNKKGIGLYSIPLRGKSRFDGKYTLDWYDSEGYFDVVELLKPTYTSILISGNVDYVTSKNSFKNYYFLAKKSNGNYDILFRNERRWDELDLSEDTLIEDVSIHKSLELAEAEIWLSAKQMADQVEPVAIIDDTLFIRICPVNDILDENLRFEKYEYLGYGKRERTYNAQFLPNGNIIVNSSMMESTEEWTPLRSVSDPFMDSINQNGDVVYYAPEPGQYYSGVFNPKNQKWVVQPKNVEIFSRCEGYLIKQPNYWDLGLINDVKYAFMNYDGSFVFKDVKSKDFFSSEYTKYKIPGYCPIDIFPVVSFSSSLNYFVTNKGTGVFDLYSEKSEIIVEPVEVVRYMPANNTSFTLDTTGLWMTIHESNGKIEQAIKLEVPLSAGNGLEISGNHRNGEHYIDDISYQSRGNFYIKQTSPTDTVILELTDKNETTEIQQVGKDIIFSKEDNFLDDVIGNEYDDWEFKVEVLSKELIYFQDNYRDFDGQIPLESLEYPGEDSIDENGMVVYYEKDPGYCHSGIYNRVEKKWIIKPAFLGVKWMGGESFLISVPYRNEKGLLRGTRIVFKQGENFKMLKDYDQRKNGEMFSLNYFNESYIYIEDFKNDLDMKPFESRIFPLEDSLDTEGNIVYQKPMQGYCKSGILNATTNQWIIENTMHRIFILEDILIAESPIHDKQGYVSRYNYAIYSKEGLLQQKNLPFDQLSDTQQKFIQDEQKKKLN
jgi:hypothetical protein